MAVGVGAKATVVLTCREVMALLEGHRSLDEIAAGQLAPPVPPTAAELAANTATATVADLVAGAECCCPELAPADVLALEDMTPRELRRLYQGTYKRLPREVRNKLESDLIRAGNGDGGGGRADNADTGRGRRGRQPKRSWEEQQK